MDRFFKLGSVTFSDSVSGYTKSIVVRGREKSTGEERMIIEEDRLGGKIGEELNKGVGKVRK